MASLHIHPLSLALVVLFIASTLGLQCYDCYYNKPESDNVVLKTIFSGITQVSSDHCKLEKPSDFTDVNIKNCPVAGPGEVYRCAVFNGEVTATVKIITDIEMKFYTITRKCVAVPTNAADYTPGCHKNPPVSDTLRSALKVIDSLADIRFEGDACYYDNLISGSGRFRATLHCHIIIAAMAFMRIIHG